MLLPKLCPIRFIHEMVMKIRLKILKGAINILNDLESKAVLAGYLLVCLLHKLELECKSRLIIIIIRTSINKYN